MDQRIIYLSPSVQHFNIGTGDYSSEEYRMNRIVDYMVPILEEKGYIVYRNNSEDTLTDIINESNRIKPDIHVAIHSNSSGDIPGAGPEIYTNRPGTKGEKLAKDVYNEIKKIYYDENLGRGVLYTNTLYEIINTLAPAILIEVAFHDNLEDASWIMQNEEKIAQAISNGIDEFFNKNI